MRATFFLFIRTPLIFFAFGLVQVVSECQAEPRLAKQPTTTQQSPAAAPISAEELAFLRRLLDSKFDVERLRQLQDQFDVKLMGLEAEDKLALEKVKSDILEEKKKIADSEYQLSHDYHNDTLNNHIYILTLVAVLSAIGTAMGTGLGIFILQEIVTRKVKEVAKQEADDILQLVRKESVNIINAVSLEQTRLMSCEIYAELSLPLWRRYEPSYQKFLRKEIPNAEGFILDVQLAELYAAHGLYILRKPAFVDALKRDERALAIYSATLNNLVYHKTAYFLCSPSLEGDIDKMRAEIIALAEECLVVGRTPSNQTNGLNWFESDQTVAFTFLKLGDVSCKEKGCKIIKELFAKKPPSAGLPAPPDNWLAALWDELFSPSGIPMEPGLGNIPRPS